ncbi:GDSL lipase/esterase - like 10 [Theobroma cacao]|nr:GDSL lipase/esterase - like 10 [Theobroma cacao]
MAHRKQPPSFFYSRTDPSPRFDSLDIACNKKLCGVILLLLGVSNLQQIEPRKPKVPCYFIFGDSLVDPGNNDELSTSAKSNYPPHGIDFPHGSTGRFSNGRTAPDFFAQYLGFENIIPPSTTAKGEEILQGVNYASGSAGIRDQTGTKLGINIGLNKQLENYNITISVIVSILKAKDSATKYLNQYLYSVGMGSNDYINNYFKPGYSTSTKFIPEQYATILIEQYSQQLTTLYSSEARKVALSGLGPIGCTPDAVASHETYGKLCTNYKITGCCEVVKETGQCVPNTAPCRNRNLFIFFDSFHPSEAANPVTATSQITSLHGLFDTNGFGYS